MDTFHIHNENQLIIRPTAFTVSTDDRPDSPRQGQVDIHMPLTAEDANQLMSLLADRFPEEYTARMPARRGTVAGLLDSGCMDVWGASLASQLTLPANTSNVADLARIPLMQLANELKAGGNTVRLYHEVTAMADAANFAPDPTRD